MWCYPMIRYNEDACVNLIYLDDFIVFLVSETVSYEFYDLIF